MLRDADANGVRGNVDWLHGLGSGFYLQGEGQCDDLTRSLKLRPQFIEAGAGKAGHDGHLRRGGAEDMLMSWSRGAIEGMRVGEAAEILADDNHVGPRPEIRLEL